jgi:hypothetical protein
MHFLLGDQVGATQTEFSSGGRPVWQGQFTPFGQELDTQTSANTYKYASLERDTSSVKFFGRTLDVARPV